MTDRKLGRELGVALLAASTLACTPTALTTGGTQVKLGKAPPHEGCRELGIVMGSGGGGSYSNGEYKLENAQNELRNKTAAQGGNFVVLDTSTTDYNGVTLSGRAFDCSSPPPAAPAAPAAVAATTQSSGGEAPPPAPSAPAPVLPAAPSVEERLLKLEDLHKKGLISDEERKKRREEILQSI
jgi:hypothetical protein